MNIPYQYEVVGVDMNARSMELRYTSDGYKPVHVSTRVPYVGETVDQVAAMYWPMTEWLERTRPVVNVDIGVTGSYTPATVVSASAAALDELKVQKLIKINAYREEVLGAGVTFNGYQFDSDPLSVSRLTPVVAAVAAGVQLPAGFVWRSAINIDVPMTAAEITALLATMIARANEVYQTSWAKKEAVLSATTAEEVLAVSWVEPQIGVGV